MCSFNAPLRVVGLQLLAVVRDFGNAGKELFATINDGGPVSVAGFASLQVGKHSCLLVFDFPLL